MAEQQNSLKIHRLPFTQVPNDLLCSNQISGMAKALWCVFYSKPDNWTFYWREIESNFKEGREAVRNAAKQLEEIGYLKKIQKKINSGRGIVFGGMEIELFPYPNQQTQPSGSNTGFPHTRSSDTSQSDSSDANPSNPDTYKDLKNQDLPKEDLLNKNLSLSISSKNPKFRTLEECTAHAKEKDYSIDVEKFHEFYYSDPTDPPKMGMAKLMMIWANNPKNYFVIPTVKKSLTVPQLSKEEIEILEISNSIKFQIHNADVYGDFSYSDKEKFEEDYKNLFTGKSIEKTSFGFVIKVDDERALKYQEVLRKIKVGIEKV